MISHSHQIPNWITRHTRVLDLGCGNGELLAQLVNSHQIDALGLELDPEKIATCLDRGLSVIQQDLNSGLSNFNDQQFDTVIMTQTLQAIRRPDLALSEMLRVGREAIVTFPNFAYIRNRMQLGLGGHMPVNPQLPNPGTTHRTFTYHRSMILRNCVTPFRFGSQIEIHRISRENGLGLEKFGPISLAKLRYID